MYIMLMYPFYYGLAVIIISVVLLYVYKLMYPFYTGRQIAVDWSLPKSKYQAMNEPSPQKVSGEL